MSLAEFAPNDRLRWARNLKGWSQAELAEQVGTSFEMVSRWERGVTVPSPYYRSAYVPSWVRPLKNSGWFVIAERVHSALLSFCLACLLTCGCGESNRLPSQDHPPGTWDLRFGAAVSSADRELGSHEPFSMKSFELPRLSW